MSIFNAQAEAMLKARHEAKQGPLHPSFHELPSEAQLALLRQAESEPLDLDRDSIDAGLAELGTRVALVKLLAELIPGGARS
jgi:hypothetical protein